MPFTLVNIQALTYGADLGVVGWCDGNGYTPSAGRPSYI